MKKMSRSGNIFFCLYVIFLLVAGNVRAETVFWSDNFETNVPSRWTTSSTWRIGSPTAGPAINTAGFRTHSGTNCASTQNYAYADSRLICTNYNGSATLTVPDASEYPRLRFWHWFNMKNALGVVDIKVGTNDWQPISPIYDYNDSDSSNGGGVWSRPSIDLSAFAGQSVQIAFRFVGLCCGNGLGWYVDDVAVVTDPPILNDPESFESGEGDWSVSAGTWEIGKPTSGPNAAHTGTNCAATVLAGNYTNNVDTMLISPPFAVPATNQFPSLHFWHWCNFNNAWGTVNISTDGSTWNQISSVYQNISISTWTNVSLDLSAYSGQTVQVAFRFFSGGIYTAAGWYVDDISLIASPMLIVPPAQTIYAGQTLSVTNSATNSVFPNSSFTFALLSDPTNVFLNTNNGAMTWTPATSQIPSTNTISVRVTDNNVPPLSTTNSFIVQVLLPPSLNILPGAQSSNSFQLTFSTGSNTVWRIDASTNLSSWLPLATNTIGPSGIILFTDLLATNYPWRFYRAVLQ
jgi:hypothetical protein